VRRVVIEQETGKVGTDTRGDSQSRSRGRVAAVGRGGGLGGGHRVILGGVHDFELVTNLVNVFQVSDHRLKSLAGHPCLGDEELGGVVLSSGCRVEPGGI
jgi:hypothetical protein